MVSNDCRMNVMTATSAEQMKYFSVTMTSIALNNPGAKLHFYIVYELANLEDIEKLQITAQHLCAEIRFIHFDTSQVDGFRYMKNAYPTVIMAACMPHLFLPEDVDRVLYLGTDVVVDKDILDFYNIDLQGNVLAACRILQGFKTYYLDQGNRDNFECHRINMDVMLMDVNRFREWGISIPYYEELFYSKKYQSKFYYALPEHFINIEFENKILYVWEPDYNYRLNYKLLFEKVAKLTKQKINKKIIHYIGYANRLIDKPWDGYLEDDEVQFYCAPDSWEHDWVCKETHAQNKIWWTYARMTPFYAEMLAYAKMRTSTIKSIYGKICDATNLQKARQQEAGYHLLHNMITLDLPERIKEYFSMKNIKNIGFFFSSLITRALVHELSSEDISIKCIFQDNSTAKTSVNSVPIILPYSGNVPSLDAVIICFYNESEQAVVTARKQLASLVDESCKIFTIQELFKKLT